MAIKPDPGSELVPWANYDGEESSAYRWAHAAMSGDVEEPIRGVWVQERDGHRLIQYQADAELAELGCHEEWAMIPEPRDKPADAGQMSEPWPARFGPMAMHTRAFLGKQRLGRSKRNLMSFCHFGGYRGAVVLKGEKLGEEMANVMHGPKEDRIVRGDSGRKRKANGDECDKQSVAWYNNVRNTSLEGWVETFQCSIPNSKESYFIIQLSPTSYVIEGGIHDLLENTHDQDKNSLSTAVGWLRKDEDEVTAFKYLAFNAPGFSDAEVQPDTIETKAEVIKINIEGGNRWDLDPTDRPIDTVTPMKNYFVPWVEETGAMISSIWSTEFGTNGLRGAIEFLTDDDQYACYEYATQDRWPRTPEFDEWRVNKSQLHRVHLQAGSEIPLSEKVLQAIAILPNDAQHEAVFDVREVLMRIVRFNLDVRGKYAYQYDLESPA